MSAFKCEFARESSTALKWVLVYNEETEHKIKRNKKKSSKLVFFKCCFQLKMCNYVNTHFHCSLLNVLREGDGGIFIIAFCSISFDSIFIIFLFLLYLMTSSF